MVDYTKLEKLYKERLRFRATVEDVQKLLDWLYE